MRTIMSDTAAAGEGPVDIFGLVGTVLEKKFRIDKIVAEGGFGVVYFGMHLTLEKPVAVKVLKTPAEFNDKARAQFIEKFALEGKTMARISHPNIVQVLDFGASPMPVGEMAPWMVLEWLSGQTLEAVLHARRGKGPFTPAETLTLLRPILEALAYAHDEGIAHRDLKPANMMLVQSKRGGTLRLMDFGIAKLMEEGETAGTGATKTRTAMNAFSPQYAAPEQLSGTRTGPWTDVHAMALIITEMLTDKAPYDGDDMTTLFGQILNPSRPTPHNRGAGGTPWDDVLARALALKPDERYKNAAEFLTALEETLPSGASATNTAAFSALGGTALQGTPTATNVSPTGPTTLRGAEVDTGVHASPPAKSKLPLVLGAGLVVVVLGVGAAMMLRGGGSNSNANPQHPASQTTQAATSGANATTPTPAEPPATNAPANAAPGQGTHHDAPAANTAANPTGEGTQPEPHAVGSTAATSNTADAAANANSASTSAAGAHAASSRGHGHGGGHGHGAAAAHIEIE
jgi:serine/threonine protein kinase